MFYGRHPDETIFQRIQSNLKAFGNRPFLRLLDGQGAGSTGSYAGVIQRCLNWIKLYQDRGLQPGSRIVVILPHSLELYTSYLGAVMGGFVPTMLHFPSPKLSRDVYFETVGQLLRSSGAQMVVTYDALADDIRRELKSHGIEAQVCTAADTPPGLLQELLQPQVSPDDTAFLQYSSGTTGLKKGVGISNRQLLWQVDACARSIELNPADVIVSWLPLYHDMGLIACYWLPILKAVPLIAMSPFDWVQRPGLLWEVVSKQRPTLCWLPNFAYNHMAKSISDTALDFYDLRSMRAIINCSEPVMDHSHQLFLQRFEACGLRRDALWASYAMAETTFAVTAGPAIVDSIDRQHFAATGQAKPVPPDHPQSQRLVSSGTALPQTEIRICDDTGHELPERQQGEIVVSSPSLMQGYLGQEKTGVEDGHFVTGDLGYLANGHLVVTGRKKDLIIVAGKNIYPQDIEAIVNSVEGVIPGRCVALGLRDEETGTEDLIVLAESHETDAAKLQQIKQQVADEVARQSEVVLRDMRLLPHRWLKKASSGKIARKANLERYLSELKDCAETTAAVQEDSDPRIRQIREILGRVLEKRSSYQAEQIFPEQSLISSGILDSLSLITLIVELESSLGVQIPKEIQTDLSHFDSLNAMAKLVDHLPAAQPEPEDSDPQRRLSVRARKTTDYSNGQRDADLIIIGSSRVDGLSSKAATECGYRSFNFAVNSAQAEDLYCLTRFVGDYTQVPIKRILLGIDIEAFNGHHSPDHRLVTCPLLRPYLAEGDVQEVEEIFPADKGLSETLASLAPEQRKRFQKVFTELRSQQATQAREFDYDPQTGDLLFHDEGIMKMAYEKRLSLCLQGLDTVADLGSHQRQTEMRLQHFHELFPRRVEYFKKIVQFCEEQEIQLTCFLTPMHPLLKELLTQRSSYAARTAEFMTLFKELAGDHCELLDCSVPELFGGNNVDFRDEVHVGPFNSDCLMKFLLGVRAASRA